MINVQANLFSNMLSSSYDGLSIITSGSINETIDPEYNTDLIWVTDVYGLPKGQTLEDGVIFTEDDNYLCDLNSLSSSYATLYP